MTTKGDAASASRLMVDKGWNSAILVSHPLHLERARLLFQEQDIIVYTSPTNTDLASIPRVTRAWLTAREAVGILWPAFEAAGIPCTYTLSPSAREVRNGINLIRAALRPAAGPPRLYYVPSENNRAFVKAMQSYRNRRVNGIWIDEPQDPQAYEHIPDALRYYFINRHQWRGIGEVRLAAA